MIVNKLARRGLHGFESMKLLARFFENKEPEKQLPLDFQHGYL